MTWLGWELDFEAGSVAIPNNKILKLKQLAYQISDQEQVHFKTLAKLAGSIASFSFVVGSISRVMTRAIYKLIGSAETWYDSVFINSEVFDELWFWVINLDQLNFKPFIPKSSTVGIIYSDASSTGFGGHFTVQCGRDWSFGSFTNKEKQQVPR